MNRTLELTEYEAIVSEKALRSFKEILEECISSGVIEMSTLFTDSALALIATDKVIKKIKMSSIKINVSKDFSPTPGPRFIWQGEYSGEAFFINLLEPKFRQALEEKKTLVVDLTNTNGFGSSFLEESFGKLPTVFSVTEISNTLEMITRNRILGEEIEGYLYRSLLESQEETKTSDLTGKDILVYLKRSAENILEDLQLVLYKKET